MKMRVAVHGTIVRDDLVTALCPECQMTNFVGTTPDETSVCRHFFAAAIDADGFPLGKLVFDVGDSESILRHCDDTRIEARDIVHSIVDRVFDNIEGSDS